jgi:hypothetical protein
MNADKIRARTLFKRLVAFQRRKSAFKRIEKPSSLGSLYRRYQAIIEVTKMKRARDITIG